MKKVTIIVPAYNEEESLPFLYERLEKLMNENTNYEFEILFVNDGSKDKTIDLIKEYREKDGNMVPPPEKTMVHPRNDVMPLLWRSYSLSLKYRSSLNP